MAGLASDGIDHQPWLNEQHPVAGASGMHERLNCCVVKRQKKVDNHFFIVSLLYVPSNAFWARKYIFAGANPLHTKL
jgi:hypothetical protein